MKGRAAAANQQQKCEKGGGGAHLREKIVETASRRFIVIADETKLVENLGIPTGSTVTTGFIEQARVVARGIGMPLAIAEYPGNPVVDTLAELESKVETALAPALVESLDRLADELGMARLR